MAARAGGVSVDRRPGPCRRAHAGAAGGRWARRHRGPPFRTLIVTGALNTRKAGITWSDVVSTPTGKTLLVKLGFVALSGAAAALHAFPPAPRSVLITVGTRREHQRWSLCLHRSTASSSRNSELKDAPHCATAASGRPRRETTANGQSREVSCRDRGRERRDDALTGGEVQPAHRTVNIAAAHDIDAVHQNRW